MQVKPAATVSQLISGGLCQSLAANAMKCDNVIQMCNHNTAVTGNAAQQLGRRRDAVVLIGCISIEISNADILASWINKIRMWNEPSLPLLSSFICIWLSPASPSVQTSYVYGWALTNVCLIIPAATISDGAIFVYSLLYCCVPLVKTVWMNVQVKSFIISAV